MQIFVKVMNGRSIVFELEPSDSIGKMKQMIYDTEGIPCFQQRLTVAGKQISTSEISSNDWSLERCGLLNESTVHVHLFLFGGKVKMMAKKDDKTNLCKLPQGRFGAMLRSLAKQAGAKKTTDFGAVCVLLPKNS